MGIFEDAQRLFKDYQENGGLNDLRSSLDILDEIIESQNIDFQRASNFRKTISAYINNQIVEILVKCNIIDFLKNPSDDVLIDKFVTILYASATKEDIEKFIELRKIKSDYFQEKAG